MNLQPKVKDHEYPEELHFEVVGNLTFTTSDCNHYIDNVGTMAGNNNWWTGVIGNGSSYVTSTMNSFRCFGLSYVVKKKALGKGKSYCFYRSHISKVLQITNNDEMSYNNANNYADPFVAIG
jgi:hypothetical protein